MENRKNIFDEAVKKGPPTFVVSFTSEKSQQFKILFILYTQKNILQLNHENWMFVGMDFMVNVVNFKWSNLWISLFSACVRDAIYHGGTTS